VGVREVIENGRLVDGDDVCDPIAGINDHTTRQALGIQTQYSLNGDIYTLKPIALKHDLTHPLPIHKRIHGRLGQQNLASPRVNSQFLKALVPEMSHVLPVADNAVFHGIRDLQERSNCSGLVTDHNVFDLEVVHAFFCTEDGPADDGGEGVFGEVGAGVSELHCGKRQFRLSTRRKRSDRGGRLGPAKGRRWYLDESGAIVEDDGYISHGGDWTMASLSKTDRRDREKGDRGKEMKGKGQVVW
jgi:hypothetical protein